jgi:hypothetical protein
MTPSRQNRSDAVLRNKVSSFLSDKPAWAWMVFYTVLTAILFGVFTVAYAMLTASWWVAVAVILLAGSAWGWVAFSSQNAPESALRPRPVDPPKPQKRRRGKSPR